MNPAFIKNNFFGLFQATGFKNHKINGLNILRMLWEKSADYLADARH